VDTQTQISRGDIAMPGGKLSANALPLRAPDAGFSLLTGVRVIDLTTSIAGPSGTMLLADMGAEAVKIERPAGGDDARSWAVISRWGIPVVYLGAPTKHLESYSG
jgi:CoA-transferase family III